MSTLEISDLHVSVETQDGPKQILRGVDLTINSGEIHAIMGPNGSGKSTLAYSIAGHPKYEVTQGSVKLDGEEVLEMSVDERARADRAVQEIEFYLNQDQCNAVNDAREAVQGREWAAEHLRRQFIPIAPDPAMDDTYFVDRRAVPHD